MLLRPHHLVHEMEKIARETFPKSITIVNSTQEGIWNVEGDTTQLHQVFLNLCVNARDAMPEGGTLTVAVENIELDDSYASMVHGAKAGSYVVFKVSDTGIGISHENMERIFDPFFTPKNWDRVTGLGLSMVMGIAQSHGGL